jgi:hypothetical protein
VIPRHFSRNAISFGFVPTLVGRLHHCHRFADAVPGIIELAEFCMSPAKYDKYVGIHTVVPVARHSRSSNAIVGTASEALPVAANRLSRRLARIRLATCRCSADNAAHRPSHAPGDATLELKQAGPRRSYTSQWKA